MQPLLPEPASHEHSLTLAVLDLHCATNVYPELCTLGFLQPAGLLMESWSSPRLFFRSLPTFFALLRKKLLSGSALGETPQKQILRPAALHTTGQCESRETSLHTNIPISRAPLNYAGESESPLSLATQQQQLMACVAVIRVIVHFVDTVAISACIWLTVINVPGHFSPVTTSNQNVDGTCPELWTTRLAISHRVPGSRFGRTWCSQSRSGS